MLRSRQVTKEEIHRQSWGGDSPAACSEQMIVVEEILTVTEVAGILKVPVSWIYDHTRPRRQNPLPSFKMGKYLRFRASDIRAYILRLNRSSTN